MREKLTKSFALIVGVLAMSLLIGYLIFAWQEPTSAPPGGNVPAPLNVGPTGQSKEGGLILNTGGAPTGLIVATGTVGIGTTMASAKLEIMGNVNISDTLKLKPQSAKTICTSAEKGQMYYEDGVGVKYCDGTSWKVTGPGFTAKDLETGDVDNDGKYKVSIGGSDYCDDDVSNYLNGDQDGDGYIRVTAGGGYCGGGTDCNDSCATCYPGSTVTTSVSDGLDQDCDGVIDELISGDRIFRCDDWQGVVGSCHNYCTANGYTAGNLYRTGSWGGQGQGICNVETGVVTSNPLWWGGYHAFDYCDCGNPPLYQ